MGKIDNIKILLERSEYDNLYIELKKIINGIGPDSNIVIEVILALILNNYLDEAEDLLNSVYLGKDKKIIIKVLKNMIKDKRNIKEYNNYELNAYFTAKKLGRMYYKNYQVEDAYAIYSWGYDNTKNPIFLYYMGKMLYKLEDYDEAINYFNSYLKNGGIKSSKAYLYLGCIEKKRRHFKNSVKYINISNDLNKLIGDEYFVDGFYDYKDKETDYLKLINERKFGITDENYFNDTINSKNCLVKELRINN